MRLIPYRTFSIETPLTRLEALTRLQGAIEPARWVRGSSWSHRPFEGVLNGYLFEIRRIIHYLNPCLPRIRGTIQQSGTGARVTGIMRLNGLARVAFWILGLGPALSGCVCTIIIDGIDGSIEALISFGIMAGLCLLFPLACFFLEADKALNLLADIVDGSDIELHVDVGSLEVDANTTGQR
jgi:hypothetical protein